MKTLEDLNYFQNQLLIYLDQGLPGEETRRLLASHPASTPFQDYVKQFSPPMMDLASDLTRRWGQRIQERRIDQ